MSAGQTISDSKRAFHKAFPHVIPPIYRRLADELLVELNLLANQADFEPDILFSIGLVGVFEAFTRGYKPAEHLSSLFTAICKSSGFEPTKIKNLSSKSIITAKDIDFSELEAWIKDGEDPKKEIMPFDLNLLKTNQKHYTRLKGIGAFLLVQHINGPEKVDQEKLYKLTIEFCQKFGLPSVRVDKDLTIYKSSLEKMSQALELIEESVEYDRKRREKGSSSSAGEIVEE